MLENFQVNDYSFDNIETLNDNLQYIDYINNNYEFKEVIVEPILAYKYQGNLFGLFHELNISPNLFLFTLYINGYNNPIEYDGNKLTFKIAIKPPIPLS